MAVTKTSKASGASFTLDMGVDSVTTNTVQTLVLERASDGGLFDAMPSAGGSVTANLGTLGGAATAAGVAAVVTVLGTPAQDGTDATGVTPPAGAVGIRGWLSSIWNKLNTSIAVTGTFFQATQPISAASLPLPTGAATAAGVSAVNTTLGTPMQNSGGSVALAAGVAAIGSVIGRTSAPSATPVITAGAYTSGQEIGGLMTFAVGGNQSGLLESIRITCKSAQAGVALKLYVFDANPSNTTWTDKSTPAINALDVGFVRGIFSLAAPDTGLGTHTIWNLEGIACSFIAANLYAILVAAGTPTFASTSDITVKLGMVDD